MVLTRGNPSRLKKRTVHEASLSMGYASSGGGGKRLRKELERAVERAKELGASYADIRVVERRRSAIAMKNDAVERLSSQRERGFGIRVLVDGGWGFVGSAEITADEIERMTQRAIAIGRASARVQRDKVTLSPVDAYDDTYRGPMVRDPEDVPLEEKLSFLSDVTRALRTQPEVRFASAGITMLKQDKIFASTEGSYIEQSHCETGGHLMALASDGHDTQVRSFDDTWQAGYEFIDSLDLIGRSRTLSSEAAQLLKAPTCPVGVTDLITGSSQLALQIHESVGHPIELDRVLGQEASYAGTSFCTIDKRGTFRYGSPSVNLVAESLTPGGLGTFGYDDEGVPAQRTQVTDKGIFKDYLMSRETAPAFGTTSNGTVRAESWMNVPMIRMNNISLEPGDWTLDEIIKDTKRGVFVDTPKSWSLDDKRLNFHFSQQIAYEVVDGARGRMLKNPAYHDLTPHFWNACDAVAGKDEWHLWGMPSCAKGEPVQIAHVSHGAAPSRFRDVKVGVDA